MAEQQGLLGNLANAFVPGLVRGFNQAKYRQQAKGIIGQPEQAYQMSQAELFPGEQPIEGLKTAGTGLMGGQLTPEQAYGQLMTLPGYEQIGAEGLMRQQNQQYLTGQAELDRQNALRLQQMRGQQQLDALNAQRKAAGQKPFPQYQAESAGYANRMTSAGQLLDEFEGQGYTGGAGQMALGLATELTGGLYKGGEQYKMYEQAKEDWVRAKLRKESGAVIGDEEMAKEIDTYFPEPGDTPKEIEQKRQRRKVAEQSMVRQSQGAYEQLFPETSQSYYQHQQQYGGRTPQEVQRERERQQAQQQAQGMGLTIE